MASKIKGQTKTAPKQEIKKLSKIGEWLDSGQSAVTIVDMWAVLR